MRATHATDLARATPRPTGGDGDGPLADGRTPVECRAQCASSKRRQRRVARVEPQLFAGLDDLELANSNIDVTACNRRREQALNARKVVQNYLDTVGLSPEARLALGTAQLHQQGNSRSP